MVVGYFNILDNNSNKRRVIMSKKENYEKKLQAQLDEWAAETDKLKAKAKGVSADVKIEYDKQVNELQKKQKAAGEKLTELKKASEDAWEELKEDMDDMWDSLGKTLTSVIAKFK
jgi:DNA anti-recombination protein RmuC